MTDIQEINVALTGAQIASVKAAVETGDYATTSDVIREAVQEWRFKRELRQEDIDRLRQLWNEGKASGPPEAFDIERTIGNARARLKAAAAE